MYPPLVVTGLAMSAFPPQSSITVAGGYDFLSRFFAPWMGIPEDHVTGSAHSVLGPYWSERLQVRDNNGLLLVAVAGEQRTIDGKGLLLRARQCSPRGGDLTVRVDAEKQRVVVSGEATVVIRGTMHVP